MGRALGVGRIVHGLLCVTLLATTAAGQGILYTYHGVEENDRVGWSVNGAGDVDMDGVPDYIVGASRYDVTDVDNGRVRVYSGIDGSQIHQFDGVGKYDQLGYSVDGAGDVNQDGHADLVAGAPDHDLGGANAGQVRVYSGLDGSLLYDFLGDDDIDWLGRSVSGAGDVNNDGHADVVAGAPYDEVGGAESGSMRIYSGLDGTILNSLDGTPGDRLGWSVSGAGDVDNDGFDDVLIGVPLHDGGGADAGAVLVYTGQTGSVLRTLQGDVSGDHMGWSVAGPGDLDGDGYHEVLAGAPDSDLAGSSSGSARLSDGFSGATLYTWHGDRVLDQYGYSVNGAGDVNNDGTLDLINGVRYDDDHGFESGSARILSGADGSQFLTIRGDAAGDYLGFSVGAMGDLNADGFDDLIVGAWGNDTVGTWSGNARVIGGTSCAGYATGYGIGCPGTGGMTPALTLSGCVSPGGLVTVEVRDGKPGGMAVLFIGDTASAVPLGGGCTLHLFPILTTQLFMLTGVGSADVTALIGYDMLPDEVKMQVFILDAAGAKGYSTSNAANVVIQK